MAKKPASESSEVTRVMELLRENSVEYVDLRFTDPRGKWQHTAQHVSTIEEDVFRDGFMFDGSSIAGWKAINESDMILMPDASTAVMDPFAAKPSADSDSATSSSRPPASPIAAIRAARPRRPRPM